MDPVHFAMIGIVSLAFGLVTPPYGLCLMIACSVAGMRIRDAIKDTGIMLVPMLMVLALVIVWPKVSLFLPQLISPEFLQVAMAWAPTFGRVGFAGSGFLRIAAIVVRTLTTAFHSGAECLIARLMRRHDPDTAAEGQPRIVTAAE